MTALLVHRPYLVPLGLASLLSFATSFALMFMAGCTGDLKGGTLGDPIAALHFESLVIPFFLVGLAAGAALFILRPQVALQHRVAHALAFSLFGGFVLWFCGLQFEVWGVQHCF